jgi:hypothetical protein
MRPVVDEIGITRLKFSHLMLFGLLFIFRRLSCRRQNPSVFSSLKRGSILIKLKHIINGAVVSEIDLGAGEFSIGRNHGNSLQLDDAVVSGQHAVISVTANVYLPEVCDISIRDLGSTNGTYVNNTLVKQRELRHGDAIRIGTYEYKVFDDQSTENTQTEYYIAED